MASFSPCLHHTSFFLRPFKGDSSSLSLHSSHPLTRTSSAFLCPPELNSTLMIMCFEPLPCLGAAAASRARRTGWGAGMAHRAGGDLAVLLLTAASANYLMWPQRLRCSLQLRWVPVCRQNGRSCCWDVSLWLDLCKHQQNQLAGFRNLCYEDFLFETIWMKFAVVVLLKSLSNWGLHTEDNEVPLSSICCKYHTLQKVQHGKHSMSVLSVLFLMGSLCLSTAAAC